MLKHKTIYLFVLLLGITFISCDPGLKVVLKSKDNQYIKMYFRKSLKRTGYIDSTYVWKVPENRKSKKVIVYGLGRWSKDQHVWNYAESIDSIVIKNSQYRKVIS